MKRSKRTRHQNPAVADELDPVTFVHKINVASSWPTVEDEQDGGHCAEPVDTSTSRHDTSGSRPRTDAHFDALDPASTTGL